MKNMKMHLLNILKGAAIGVANVIPGFSGGTMAVLLKIYDLFVYAFANVFNDFINVVKKCWSLFLGILIGILFALVVIVKLLEVIPFITVMFFVGLILGSIPQIYKKSKEGKIKTRDIISLIIAILIIVLLPLVNENAATNINYNFGLYIILFFMGVISASSMVIPGVSGSLVLMAFGYYTFVMTTIKDYLINIFNFSLESYWGMFFSLLFFGLGCIVGVIFISKLITILTNKYPKTVYFTILGLLLASPFSIIYSTCNEYVIKLDVPTVVFSIISLILGAGLVLLGEYLSNKNKIETEETI